MQLNAPLGSIIALDPAYHQSAFERRHNQRCHRLGIHSGPCFAPFLSLLHDRLQTTQPRTKSFADVCPEDRIAIVRIDGSVQNWTSARNWRPVINEIRDELLELFYTVRLFIHMQQTSVP